MLIIVKKANFLIFAVCVFVPQVVFATSLLEFLYTEFETPISLTDTVQAVRVRNNTIADTQPFQLRLWVSIDNVFDDNDRPVTLDQPRGLDACPTGINCPLSPNLEFHFKFPFPGEVIDPSERLFGDTRTPSQWIGQKIFHKTCLSINGGPFSTCTEGERFVIAPEARLISASRGTSTSSVDLKWVAPPFDNGVALVSSYELTETRGDSLGGSRNIVVDVNDLEIVDEPNGERNYLYTSTAVEPGVSYSYTLRACSDIGTNVTLCPDGGSGFGFAFARGQFSASQGTLFGGVEVAWPEFSVLIDGYDLRRCRADAPTDCTIIVANHQSTSYFDSSAERGVEYLYEVFSCNQYLTGSNNCDSDSFYEITGITNAGFPSLLDAFEDDDNVQEAKQVRNTVSQLHSFHTNDDQDWVEIILTRPQVLTITTSGDTFDDTELTLFSADGTTQIGYNDNPVGLISAYAALMTDKLSVGRYFLKVNQRPSHPVLFRSVANYRLELEFAEGSFIMVPITDLLLGEK